MTVSALGRAFELYRRTAYSRSAILLLIANLIPVVGVVFFGWSLHTILVIYWLENGIVGFWNVPKILLAQGSVIPTLPELPPAAALAATRDPARAAALRDAWRSARDAQAAVQSGAVPGAGRLPGAGRAGLAIFFLIHYGMFWFVHGVFVFALPLFAGDLTQAPCLERTLPPGGDLGGVFPGAAACAPGAFGEVLWGSVAIAAVALVISHGASFVFNYLGRAEYLSASPMGQMGAPYARVVVLHLTIIFGSMVVAFLGAPIATLLVLVGLKTAFDLGLHLREHRSAGSLVQPS